MGIATLAVRALQLIFSVVALVLPIILLKDYGPEHLGPDTDYAPESALMGYGAFCGGVGILIACVGVVATFLEPLQGIVMLALDGLTSFFLLAGGLAYAIKVGTGSCTDTKLDTSYLERHINVFRPSKLKNYGTGTDANKYVKAVTADTESRCHEFQAETAFLWLTFAAFVGALLITFLGKGRGRAGNMV